jgi:hypothetical protein
VLLAAALLCIGCASPTGTGAQSKAATAGRGNDPEIGMSKDQVVALYGKTENVRTSSEGETWIYNLNAPQASSWNLGYRPKLRIIDFDKEGKVKSWDYSE